MSLSASMWTGISGLLAHGEKMNVIGNNLANVNTVGFKGARMDFEDFIQQDVNSAAGVTQVGRGVSIGAIYGDFSQGAFETTNEATDLAISGKGFFQVKVPNEDTEYYTRSGNFRFNKDGYLTDPHGYRLQGWQIETPKPSLATGTVSATSSTSSIKGAGVPRDVQLEGFTAEPKHTSNVTLNVNLDSTAGNNKSVPTTPEQGMTSLFNAWDGTAATPLADDAFAYQTTIKVYDEGGTAHNLTVYFDQVADSEVDNLPAGQKQWEYIVTVPPSEDGRYIADSAASVPANVPTGFSEVGGTVQGLLMTGTLTFDSGGQLVNQSAFTLNTSPTAPDLTGTTAADSENKDNWVSAPYSTNGFPLFSANFTSLAGASSPFDASPEGSLMELNFGLKHTGTLTSTDLTTVENSGGAGNPPDFTSLPGSTASFERESSSTTSFNGASSTLKQSQDGYTFGFLQNVSVDRDGILRGRYSNGVILDLYQITLYDFQSEHNLRREGGNLFSATRDSGEAAPGPANANGFGSIHSNSLEQSNVDMAKEFVTMITTQRGFQGNSKVITTTDRMLETVVQMKR